MAQKPIKVERVNRAVIDSQLLTGLDDKSKVAILASQDDLDLMISAFEDLQRPSDEAVRMEADLKKLRAEAFGAGK